MPELIDPSAIQLKDEDLAAYGTIVNMDGTPSSDEEAEKQILELSLPVSLNLKLTPEQQSRLNRLCNDNKMTPDQYVQDLLLRELAGRVGKPLVTGPSRLSGATIQQGSVNPLGPSGKTNLTRISS